MSSRFLSSGFWHLLTQILFLAASPIVSYAGENWPQWRQVYSSPVAANGHIFMTGRDGTTVVMKDGPQFEVVSTNVLDEPVDASLVMIGDATYIRGAKHLYCIGGN